MEPNMEKAWEQRKTTAIVRPIYTDVYQDGKGEWRYRFRSSNGNILCSSGDGYVTASGCRGALTRFVNKIREGTIVYSNRPKSLNRIA